MPAWEQAIKRAATKGRKGWGVREKRGRVVVEYRGGGKTESVFLPQPITYSEPYEEKKAEYLESVQVFLKVPHPCIRSTGRGRGTNADTLVGKYSELNTVITGRMCFRSEYRKYEYSSAWVVSQVNTVNMERISSKSKYSEYVSPN